MKTPPTNDRPPFDPQSGTLVERTLFNNRPIALIICAILTCFFGFEATHARLNASFEKTIPTKQTFIANYLANQNDLAGLGNAVQIVVESKQGNIYSPAYLAELQKISDTAFLVPGVDRGVMKSLWTPTVRWIAVTAQGFDGGPVIGQDYDGSLQSIAKVRQNVERSGEIGQIVAPDLRSSMIYVPLLSSDGASGPLDYGALAGKLDNVRSTFQDANTRIRIVGFAQVIGDLIHGLHDIVSYFALSVLIAILFLYWYTRDVRSTLIVVVCSLIAVLWQVGLITLLGFDLDPYSILVPFLIFAIGMSHGAQKMNGIMQDIGRGLGRLPAARYTFRRLFIPGLTALICDAVGFGVLLVIQIQVIQDLAVIASLGVAILVITNLIVLPISLSYIGVSDKAALRSLASERVDENQQRHIVWRALDLFTRREWATGAICVAALLAVGGLVVASHLTVGDLDSGAPELQPNSRYNQDVAYVNQHYGASSDVFAVMVKTPDWQCASVDTLEKVDALGWQLRQLPGVASVDSLATANRSLLVLFTEGSPKWYDLSLSPSTNNMLTSRSPRGMYDDSCNLLTIYVYLTDHRASTLNAIVQHVQSFAAVNDTDDVKFLLAAGNAGIMAATNIAVDQASRTMLLWVYAAVVLLAMMAFRSWRAVICAVIPLMLTSILAEALMVGLHIGVKVATLPVVALGVGIGVDYSLYIMSVLLANLRAGMSLSEAYYRALLFTGRVVMLTGITLSVGVATWSFSPIKFQSDMGTLLAFMFLWNMLGALILLPSLSCFLLNVGAREQQSRIRDAVMVK